jgi:DNA polymerase III subunit epsilon
MGTGIWDRRIDDTPIAIMDCETTGLYAGADRIVELSVMRLDPGGKPTLVFDSLVNPRRRMAATEIHGITDSDVSNAPTFDEIAPEVLLAFQGAVVATYNVYFDMPFIQFEMRQCDIVTSLPHFCLMYLRPMLGLGRKCSLSDACKESEIALAHAHTAGSDVTASAALWQRYLRAVHERRISTFGELASLKNYKFVESFQESVLTVSTSQSACRCNHKKPRTATTPAPVVAPRVEALTNVSPAPPSNPLAEYWDTLAAVLADLTIDEAELQLARDKRVALGLSIRQIRAIHAKVYAHVIAQVTADKLLDDHECSVLKRLNECLRILGWAPGM